ncbi:MAG: cytochrome c3 family protein [Desulfobacterales bacterium]|nr:cytochrome c3 family protein [Desulfobacterales bacterium]
MKTAAAVKNLRRLMGRNRTELALIGHVVVLTGLFLYFFYGYPLIHLGPEQPIPFSHRVHAGDKNIACLFCHSEADRSAFPGIPPVEKCLFCHQYIIANHPEIQKLHGYFNTGTPIPWKKVNYLPEHVFFKHQRHVRKEIACDRCHGPVETMDRLSGEKFQMGFCVNCHKEKKASVDCWLACHN